MVKERRQMTKLAVNQKGKVIDIATRDHKKLQKIMAMGILPGVTVALIQKYPSYVFQVGQSQFAIDKELACCIRTGPLHPIDAAFLCDTLEKS